MGNETAGDIPSYDNTPSIIQLSRLQWPTLRIASALKLVEFVSRVGKLCHGRHPCQNPASIACRVSRPPRQAFASHGTTNPLQQLEMQGNRMHKIPAAGARLVGYCLISCQALRFLNLSGGHRGDIINQCGVIEGEEYSPGTQTSDEARLETQRYFHRPPDLSWVYLSQVFFCSSRCSFIICQSSSFSFRSLSSPLEDVATGPLILEMESSSNFDGNPGEETA